MATRYIGDAVVRIAYHDSGDYRGTVSAGGHAWRFSDLHAPKVGGAANRFGYDSPEAYDEQAAAAVAFGSYYTSHNRGGDCPDWAPFPECADAISEATQCETDDQGRYSVRRSANGKVRVCS